MMPKSMRGKLTLWYTSMLALVLTVFAGSTYAYLVRATGQKTDDSLIDSSELVVASLGSELGERNKSASQTAQEVLEDFRFRDRQIVIFDGNHEVLATSELVNGNQSKRKWPKAEDFATLSTVALSAGKGCSTLKAGHGIRFCGVGLHNSSGDFVVVTAKSLYEERESLEQVRTAFGIAIPVALVLASLGGFLLANRSLAPVAEMGDRAARISSMNLHERLPVKSERDEVGRLAIIINDLLSRLDSSFDQQRRFVADASHELRTPLAIVLGEAEVTLSRQVRAEEEYRQSLHAVYSEGKRMSRIVEDLFSLARADAGKYPVRQTACSLDKIIEQCLQSIKYLADKKGVALSFPRPEIESVIQGDEDLLRRMVMNLVDNAIKYTMPGGAVLIEILQQGGECVVVIQDTGRGIGVEAQPHIFERFYREDTVRRRNIESEGSGAGLGLSISQWIAELHRGRVVLESSSSVGSIFSVRLPYSSRG